MTTTAILNAILAVGVIGMVLTPLVWAILTQRRDHPRQTITHPAGAPRIEAREHRATRRRRYTTAAGRA